MELGAITLDGLLKIVISNIVLSGDNAVVIALAVTNLPVSIRRLAVTWGTLGAIVLRVLFTMVGTMLLGIPLLRVLGGVTLLWIGWKLMAQTEESSAPSALPGELLDAIRTVIIADAVMSLDNALAVAAIANGNIPMLTLGLALSIPLLMIGANAISGLFKRFPWLTLLGAGLIAWVAIDVLEEDVLIHQWLPWLETNLSVWALRVLGVGGVLLLGARSRKFNQQRELNQATVRASLES